MYLAVSNIAWGSENFSGYVRLLSELGCDGVEIAPSLIWNEPILASLEERREIRSRVHDLGLKIVGLHSLLYTRPDLVLFGSPDAQQSLAEYVKRLFALCSDLGGRTMIFGSGPNRNRGTLNPQEALDRAVPVFYELAQSAASFGVYLCIEPLTRSETDFINTTAEGLDLTAKVGHLHFRLHLDARVLLSSGEECIEAIASCNSHVAHCHVSDPGLAPPGSTGADHQTIANALRRIGYNDFVSIEMRRGFGPPHEIIRCSVDYVRERYCRPNGLARN